MIDALLSILLVGSVAGVDAGGAPSLDDTLNLVPESAEILVLVPSLGRANQDLGQMIDGMNRPGTVLAGRPIEMLKAEFGITSGLDEVGSAAIYLVMPRGEDEEPEPVFLLPTEDPEAFITGNYPDVEPVDSDLWVSKGTETRYLRALEGHVLISGDRALAERHQASDATAKAFKAAAGERFAGLSKQTDVVVWAKGESFAPVLDRFAGAAPVDIPGGIPGGMNPEMMSLLLGGMSHSLVLVDFDPLGLSIRTLFHYEEGSTFHGLLPGGPSSGRPMDRLPGNPYYFALSADLRGLGGHDVFRSLVQLSGMPMESLPEALQGGTLGLEQVQIAAYPSRLGIGLGGLMNDSAMVFTARDPEKVETAFRDVLMSVAGERGGVRYQPEWVDDKPLRTGGTSDAFRLKETVLPPSRGDRAGGQAQSAIQRMALQLLYGSRGLSGFAGVEGSAFVMTLSQRPDVWGRALSAAAANGGSIADSPVIRSMRPWLLESPDVEFLLGMGTLTKLLEQISRSLQVGLFDPEMLPQIPENTPPVAFDLSVDDGSLETATVIPTGVIAIGFDQVLEQMTRGFGGQPGDRR